MMQEVPALVAKMKRAMKLSDGDICKQSSRHSLMTLEMTLQLIHLALKGIVQVMLVVT